jgi:hypothetical protein
MQACGRSELVCMLLRRLTSLFCSSSVTAKPSLASLPAATRPPTPPPTMMADLAGLDVQAREEEALPRRVHGLERCRVLKCIRMADYERDDLRACPRMKSAQ